MTVLYVILGIFYITTNVLVANLMPAAEMKKHFMDGQCLVGRVCANLFYAPAWALKGLRAVVLATVK